MPDDSSAFAGPEVLVSRVRTREKVVALTFDDGPDPTFTPQLLEVFAAHGGHGTFYMVGAQIEKAQDVAMQVHEEGHEIGNHTFSHPFLSQLTSEAQQEELLHTDRLIRHITSRPCLTFRPPYLDADERVFQLAAAMGYQSMGAVNLQARDWDSPGVEHILEHTLSEVQPGSILIFHDGYGDRSQTVEAVRRLVPELVDSGYRLVTVSQLLGLAEVE